MIRTLTAAVCLISAGTFTSTEENRTMWADIQGIQEFHIDAGAGKLEIRGDRGAPHIRVEANIVVDTLSTRKARNFIEEYLVLDLTTHGSTVSLRSYFEGRDGWDLLGLFSSNMDGRIDLVVTVPEGVSLKVDDGSGNMIIEDCGNPVELDDGSGNIRIRNVRGDVSIDDGSGNILMENITGNVDIDDGSGSMDLRSITGNVVVDDGSGSLSIRHVNGSVNVDDGSGSIDINTVSENVVIIEQGSGGTRIRNVAGRVDEET